MLAPAVKFGLLAGLVEHFVAPQLADWYRRVSSSDLSMTDRYDVVALS